MARDEYLIELLGAFKVLHGNASLALSFGASRLAALLALRGDLPRAQAADVLWPNAQRGQCSSNLRTVLWRLGQQAPGLVQAEGSTLRLCAPEPDIERLLQWTHDAISGRGQAPPPYGVTRELLPGWDEPWVEGARSELHLLRVHALEAAGTSLLLAGRVGEACEAAMAAVSLDPLRESAARLLVEVHLRGGNTVEALRCYKRFADLLEREIGTRPGTAITATIAAHLGDTAALDLRQGPNS